ncbi:YcdB/YcdC domain-containing protein, partial [Halorubrum sp. Atlit-9R]|uniref:YcdB/YcdC domain-containing protein n=1 Tax=Halorubrum sp. Atlit-9R TaxID=2282127 RepID=UPI0018F510A1
FLKKVNGKNQGSIHVRINADTGQLLAFDSYVNNPTTKPTYPLKVERDNAKEIALKFIANMAASYYKQIKFNDDYGVQILPPLTGEVRHTLRFDRMVDGIPFVGNYIDLEVDSEGHILRYSLQWDDTIKFPEVNTQLSLEQANEKLRAAANPILNYIIPYN